MIISLLVKLISFIVAICGAVSIPVQSQQPIPIEAETYDVSVMSYNVYVLDGLGFSHDKRVNGIISTITNEMPDVLGVQEANKDWMERLSSSLTDYSFVGRGRDKNPEKGEFSPIFYKTEKYNLIDSGTFWFSKTPDEPSMDWGAYCNRICTYVVLEDKATGFDFAVFNSHWDHLSPLARVKSAEILSEKTEEIAGDIPIIITGDFNCKADTPAYVKLVESGFIDSKYVSESTADLGTYHGYTKKNTAGDLPIDHILFKGTNGFAHSYKVITDKYDNKYPSDHFAILSEITLYK